MERLITMQPFQELETDETMSGEQKPSLPILLECFKGLDLSQPA
jgi:hypothetical protein